MVAQLKYPELGVIIPCLLIGGSAYGAHFFLFRKTLSTRQQVIFEIYACIVWLSYYLAIKVEPGSPPKNFEPKTGEWKRWCKKCKLYKPERCHHCRTCDRCVLKMDHHCPWTYNCVGYGNFPHFMRFLIFTIAGTSFVFQQLVSRSVDYYRARNLPSYLMDYKELVAVVVLIPITGLVLLTLSILLFRCLLNMARGMTQIEIWQMERIQSQVRSEAMWLQIRKNFWMFKGREMPQLASWKGITRGYEEEETVNEEDTESQDGQDSIVPENFTEDDFVFPYNLGIWQNTVKSCGPPWLWLFLWGKPNGSGFYFDKNDDDELDLPWPPDGAHQLPGDPDCNTSDIELRNIAIYDESIAESRPSTWRNEFGEGLDDFGVDMDTED